MRQVDIGILVIGGAVLFLGLFSRLFKRWGLPDPLLMLVLGVALGPKGLDLFYPQEWGRLDSLLERVAEVTLGIGLMGVALRLPKGYLPREWRSLALILGVMMPFMWLSSSLLLGLIVGMPVWMALLTGAIVTPTDPVVASAIVTGDVATESLPQKLRNSLSGESGANDGLALLFVMLPTLILTRAVDEALAHWLTRVLVWEVGGAIVVGAVTGHVMGRLLKWCEHRKLIEKPSILDYTTALALFTLFAVKLMGSNGILAVFVAGLAFDWAVDAGERMREERVVEGIDRFFTLPIFVLLGMLIPWDQWLALGWRGALLAAAILLLRRLPMFLTLTGRLHPVPHLRDTLFLGWFGPMGVASLYYSGFAMRHTGIQTLWGITSLLICSSIVVHGLTATPFTRLYGWLGNGRSMTGRSPLAPPGRGQGEGVKKASVIGRPLLGRGSPPKKES